MFERYREIIPDFGNFLRAVRNFDLVSIRVNTLKAKPSEVMERLRDFGLERVKWYSHALVITKNKEKIAKTLDNVLGYVHIQRLESMIPALVLRPKKHELVLDLCAAPGSKTTQMAQMMKNTGRIVANDVSEKRLRALFSNLERLGVINTTVTKYDGREFPLSVKFDKVLVDVPCSGEGRNFREKPIALSKKLCRKQLKLLHRGIDLAREGGEIVYSTCTLSPIENELVVSKIIEAREDVKLERIRLRGIDFVSGAEKWLGLKFSAEVKKCARFYPHLSGTGGFFVAKFRKI